MRPNFCPTTACAPSRSITTQHPYVFSVNGMDLTVRYQPAESDSRPVRRQLQLARPDLVPGQFSASSNRCRNFITTTAMISRSNARPARAASSRIDEAADELASRLTRIFLKDESGSAAGVRQHPRLQNDPHFRDYVLFYEYFHGDTGRGVGASHQTGWTGLVAKLLHAALRPRPSSDRASTPAGEFIMDAPDPHPRLTCPEPVHAHAARRSRLLLGQKALVTGASSGIGRAIALALGRCRRGCRRQLRLRRGQGRAGLAEEIRASGVRGHRRPRRRVR